MHPTHSIKFLIHEDVYQQTHHNDRRGGLVKQNSTIPKARRSGHDGTYPDNYENISDSSGGDQLLMSQMQFDGQARIQDFEMGGEFLWSCNRTKAWMRCLRSVHQHD